MKTVLAAGIFVLVASGMAIAETRPQAGNRDSRVTYATYQEGQVYTIHTRVRNVSLIELGNGETIRSIAIGDSEAFQVEKLEGSNVFTIKPVLAGVSANLTVETNRRFYFLNVVESGAATPNWSVKFTVPGGGRSGTRTAASVPPEAPMSYRVISRTSGADFTPVGISDDGRRTMFQVPPGAPIPSIFRADGQGQEYSVNTSVNGTIITVGARSERWVLRYGDQSVCVEGQPGGRS
ncbi:TrbG/VirB9 family P-type conjugative transfer protein [Paracoccus albus]|uniref:TrbG/VirB9 family P-type conjugative transfer protein n=1 Tax=Paracoccus albus TaxID=3017784 RepID=UPI0022F12009|nr:TrbG/VirB9 family P-type conjugative transfer protein [Paracoccus albus]WBU62212.1 TrbG/VirB9 family P-type conjugative transfer protein [Paracoccus albus]